MIAGQKYKYKQPAQCSRQAGCILGIPAGAQEAENHSGSHKLHTNVNNFALL